MKWLETSLIALTAQQHGLLTRRQLAEAGLGPKAVHRLRARGVLVPRGPLVFALAGTPTTRAQARLAAVLDAAPAAALGFLSAARVWGMYRRSEGRPHIVRRRDERHRSTPHLGVVHTSLRLPPAHVVTIDGIPVTTPARTVVDLALTEHFGRVARLLDNAWGRRLLTIGELSATLQAVRARGRRGVRVLDLLIEERLGMRPAESALELRFEEILRRHRLPAMDRQVDLGDSDGWVCRADYARLDDALVVFIDSATYHRALLDRDHDDEQTARLRAMGLDVLRFSDAEILYDAPAVAGRVRRARAA
jgi:very-short-patch-repair endonuclease